MVNYLEDAQTGAVYKTDRHQHISYWHLYDNPYAGLFLEMSLSKTVIMLSYLYDMHYREAGICRTLVVSTDKIVRVSWPNEIEKWAHLNDFRYSVVDGDPQQRLAKLDADAELFLIGVANFQWLHDLYIKKNKSKKWTGRLPFDCIVFDESSLFKNPSAARTKAAIRATRDMEYVYIMTGTPATNGYHNIWAQIKLLDRGKRLGRTFKDFVNRYFTVRTNQMGIVTEYRPKKGAIADITRRIGDIVISMKAKDAGIELPDMEIKNIVLQMNLFDKNTYDELEREYILECFEGDEAVTVKTTADLTNKLLQLSSGAIYVDKEHGRKWYEVNTVKMDALEQLFNDYPDENFIVVYNFKHEAERILARFPFVKELGKGKHSRESMRAWNAGEIRALMFHPASGGHGLNLQFGGTHMVWVTTNWDLELWEQTISRLRRRGGADAITVWRLVCLGTRDADVIASINKKGKNQNFLMQQLNYYKSRYEREK